MSVANLTRYNLVTGDESGHGYGAMEDSVDGRYVKFEEAVEDSSNSLQQPHECHLGNGVGCNTEVCPSSDGPCPCDDKT
jgi:hypothetical protein